MPLLDINTVCLICRKRVLSHCHYISCAICHSPCHINCLPMVHVTDNIFTERDTNNWYCPVCINSVFPFNHIDDDDRFLDSLAEFQTIPIPVSFASLNDKVFNPFESNDDPRILPLVDIDPDLNFYNTIADISTSCDYHFSDTFNKQCSQMNINSDHFSALHFNIRSLPKHQLDLETFLSTLFVKFTVIGLTETWLSPNSVLCYDLDGYTSVSRFRNDRIGGGVSLLIKDGISYNVIEDLSLIHTYMESLFVEIDASVFKTSKNILIGVIYRPPDSNPDIFNEKFAEVLSKINVTKYECYFLGDYNINLLNSDSHIATANFVDLMFENNLYPSITKPTRVTEKSATLIDNIFINNITNSNQIKGILYCDITDHFPVYIINFSQNVTHDPGYIRIRDYSERNKTKFQQCLQSTDWAQVLNSNDATDAFNVFHKTFVDLYMSCFPMKTFKSGYRNKLVWLTSGMKKSIKHKQYLFYKMRRHPSCENITNYKGFRNKLNYLLRKEERNYYETQLNRNKYNLKKTWSILKDVINKKRPTDVSKTFNINNKTVSNKSDIASAFNKYFVGIGPSLSQKIPVSDSSPSSYIHNHNVNSIFLKPVLENEVKSLIKNLKSSSPGWDNISADIIKTMFQRFLTPLTHILNLSIIQGTFPDSMKIAKVIPLFKSGDKMKINNYRPISVLPVFSKLLERIMYNRILEFIENYDILYEHQFGFRIKHSTSLALSVLVEKITSAFNEQNYMIGVFLDFSKAFDTVDHTILLRKLELYGIRGLALKWIESYLTDRFQFVCFDQVDSSYEKVVCGVPQGSILGPLLFLLYINDLADVSNILFPILFADDSNMFCTGKNLNDICNTMNQELSRVVEWLNVNKLSLNIDKSHFMVFSNKKYTFEPIITVNNTPIDRIYETKFLGVIIDSKLTWKAHINYIKSKVAKGIGILCKARKTLNSRSLMTLYYSFIYPYFVYCVEIWGGTHSIHVNTLLLQQKRIVRLLSNSKRLAHTEPLFKSLKMLTISKLYTYRMLLFLFKFHNKILPRSMHTLFSRRRDIHSHNTRQSNSLNLPKCCSNIMKHSFIYNAVILYNKSVTKFDFSQSYYTFKKSVIKYLIDDDL